MRVRVDHGRCQGHALCSTADGAIFTLDDDGYSNVEGWITVEGSHRDGVLRAAKGCPERAIQVEGH